MIPARPSASHCSLVPACAAALIALLATSTTLPAQMVTERPPNMNGTWVGDAGVVHFNFLHRFQVVEEANDKVINYPTFLLGAGLPGRTMVGARYATNSTLVAGYPNEWEFFGRWNPIARANGAPIDATLHAGYNNAAESFDAELTVARELGPVRLLAAGRYLGNAFNSDESRFAVAGGATLALNSTFALAADIATLTDLEDEEGDVAWGAGLQIHIPYTPHSLSLQATNTNTHTIQGASLGASRTRWGFEFTIPITLRRYFGGGGAPAAAPQATTTATGDTVRIAIRNLAYQTANVQVDAGTTVVWVNEDQVEHTVTANDGSFDSGTIAPGANWARTFDTAGSFAYHCVPHPFMRGSVAVR